MALLPYFENVIVELSSGGVGTGQIRVPEGETLEVSSIRFESSNGAFGITGIQDSRGKSYSNASSSNVMPGEMFADVDDGFNGLSELPMSLLLEGNNTLSIDLLDESAGANNVHILVSGIRNDGS